MELSEDFFADVELLNLFTLDSAQAGLKIHHNAAPRRIASAKRLFDKHLITQVDGGYLTPLGISTAEHAQILISVLQSDG
ncbi:MAG: TIGR02647 family protein [Proteobacteria bacterium]|jgi:uncharacterized protein (TIGR02647 family)|nr:TIGR02647 family protein [Pseudomonadota bacterium]MDA1300415.1 TIGR02647 family protein [Pseudomonadota bacterium]